MRQLGEERVRQLVHAAGDLLHVDVRAAEVLAQDLHQRVVHVRLEEVHDREVLDRARGPAAEAQELVERVLVVVANDLVPGGVALAARPWRGTRRWPPPTGRRPSGRAPPRRDRSGGARSRRSPPPPSSACRRRARGPSDCPSRTAAAAARTPRSTPASGRARAGCASRPPRRRGPGAKVRSVWTRPPTRFCASSTTTSWPWRFSS